MFSYEGVVPVTVRPPQAQNIATTLPTVHMIIEVSKAAVVLTTSLVLRLLKSKVLCFLSVQCILYICSTGRDSSVFLSVTQYWKWFMSYSSHGLD